MVNRLSKNMSVNDHAADVLTVPQVLVALVHLVEGVRASHELVQLQLTGVVESQQPHDVAGTICPSDAPSDDSTGPARSSGPPRRRLAASHRSSRPATPAWNVAKSSGARTRHPSGRRWFPRWNTL